MAVTYAEFDTTPATFAEDVAAKVLLSTHWSNVTPASPTQTTLTSAASSGATTFNVTSTTGFTVGQAVVFEPGTANEGYGIVSSVNSATSFSISNGLTPTRAIGAVVRFSSLVLKVTTTRGADCFIDLKAGNVLSNVRGVSFARTLGSTTDRMLRNLYWRGSSSGMAMTNVVHCVLSVSKDHFYLSVEGPRATETGTTNTTYGSLKNYMFMSDLVPYNAGDTVPAWVAYCSFNSPYGSVANNDHRAAVSRSADNTTSYSDCRLATLTFPNINSGSGPVVMEYKMTSTIDGKDYLAPYVVYDEREGLRGRLSNIFYGGGTYLSIAGDLAPPVGERLDFGGVIYRLIVANKGDFSSDNWGPLGRGFGGSNPGYSVVIAIPVADVP